MSTLKVDNLLNSAGNESPISVPGAAKAWVNFNGTTGTLNSSDVTIRSSFNVSSVTDYGTGNYGVNFTTAFSDANYATVATQRGTSIGTANGVMGVEISSSNAPTTSAVRVWSKGPGGTGVHDATAVCVAVFR